MSSNFFLRWRSTSGPERLNSIHAKPAAYLRSSRADMDHGMEQAEKEVQPRLKSFLRPAGTCEGSVRRTSRRFDRPDVLIALATIEGSRMATHSSFAVKSLINIESEFRSRYSNGLFEDEDSYTWRSSDQLTLFLSTPDIESWDHTRGDYVGMTSAAVEIGDIITNLQDQTLLLFSDSRLLISTNQQLLEGCLCLRGGKGILRLRTAPVWGIGQRLLGRANLFDRSFPKATITAFCFWM